MRRLINILLDGFAILGMMYGVANIVFIIIHGGGFANAWFVYSALGFWKFFVWEY